ncbi:MAG: site-2 protease family protein [Chloroflexi bacterium]|nr:MAG: site-2 protease family protein [Chloroflexota bacterium]
MNVVLSLMIIASFLGAVALHEWSHALVASWLGDSTPRTEDRQTLRLPSHVDPVGLILCIVLAFRVLGAGPMGLGWGKPVKLDAWKMRVGPNAGVLLATLAGPVFSFLLGLLVALIVHFLGPILLQNIAASFLLQLLIVFASVNICLALFNLVPLYPLDGYQILYTLLPSKQAVQFSRWAVPYGPFIILIYFFLLPFLASLSGLDDFPLFLLGKYILQTSLSLIALVYSAGSSNPGSHIFTVYFCSWLQGCR